jgi:hypothetical protein
MATETSYWNMLMDKISTAPKAVAAETQPKNAFNDEAMKSAQRRASQYYFRTGENRPLDDFKNDPSLK